MDRKEKNCTKCGATDIPESLSTCPGCGVSFRAAAGLTKNFQYVLWVIGGIFLLALVSSFFDGGQEKQSSSAAVRTPKPAAATRPAAVAARPDDQMQRLQPENQAGFIRVVSSHRNKFGQAVNELQESTLRTQRKAELERVLPGMAIRSWVGTIDSLSTTRDGRAALSVVVAPDIKLKTWNNSVSDTGNRTLIPTDSPLYALLRNTTPGQRIMFSGTFFQCNTDHARESSLTIKGSMQRPEYIFRFESIALLTAGM